MANKYDIKNMDMGIDGWNIKVPAAQRIVRRKLNVKSGFGIRIQEIQSPGDEVIISYVIKEGRLPWADTTQGGLTVSRSEFNAAMNS
ncbi:MAG: hypothetical protein KTR29_06790 [Rhodothermaceae bacterium]|nr:hypothetical protein [Rhodothermaceae bacterium]